MNLSQPSKLPLRLKQDYGQHVLACFRKLEKIEERIAAFQNHLHFTLHCRHHGIFPPSLQLKCSMKGQAPHRILDRAQMNAR